MEAGLLAKKAGCDTEIPVGASYRNLPNYVRSGELDEKLIDESVRRILTIKFKRGLLDVYKRQPHYCITIGINEIAHARKIRLGCFRDWHRSVVRHAAYGEKTAHFPVSLLQDHPDINIKFTEFVANLPE